MKADAIELELWSICVRLKLCFRGILDFLLDNIVYGNNERKHVFVFVLWL